MELANKYLDRNSWARITIEYGDSIKPQGSHTFKRYEDRRQWAWQWQGAGWPPELGGVQWFSAKFYDRAQQPNKLLGSGWVAFAPRDASWESFLQLE